MTREEMKNRISMALKDPILQQGFECICKENAEFDCQKNRNKSCYSCANATERCFRNEIGCPCQKYKSYKEEIAELKAYNEKLLDGDIEKHNKIVELQNRNGELAGQKASLERWLGKAKEIIKRLLKATYGEGWNYSLQVKVEAEKFLKELE